MSTLPEYTQGPGYRIYRALLPRETSEFVFNNSTVELLFYVFHEILTPENVANLLTNYGLQVTKLICDSKLRREMGISGHHDSKVLKTSGKTSLYMGAHIRDHIRRNPQIFDVVASIYGNRKLAYTNGLEHFLYKPFMSEESAPVLDCKLFEPLEDVTGANNPFHYTCLVCLSSPQDSTTGVEANNNDASLCLLENFDFHYDLLRELIAPAGRYPIAKQKKKLGSVSLLENLNLHALNSELLKIHRLTGKPENTFRELKWKNMSMKTGDVIVFDCRIPYMTFKNRFDLPAMYVPVSLRPVSTNWYGSKSHSQVVASMSSGKVGDWERRKVKGCNLDEYSFRTTIASKINSRDDVICKTVKPWIKSVQGINTCTDLSSFTEHDLRLFGLVPY